MGTGEDILGLLTNEKKISEMMVIQSQVGSSLSLIKYSRHNWFRVISFLRNNFKILKI